MKKVIGFGEVMVRLSPVGPAAFGDSNVVQMHAGGSEANVLAKVGCLSGEITTELITALKDDLAGCAIRRDLQQFGVGLSHVRWANRHRNGLYYVEQGMGPIVARVDYDRNDSAIANLEPDESLFNAVEGASACFISGITPALSDSCRANTELLLRRAAAARVPVFFDVNYRAKLWTASQARQTLQAFLDNGWITALITTETDAKKVFEIDEGVDDTSPMETLIARSEKVLRAFRSRFGDRCSTCVLTIRKRITNETGVWTSAALLPDGSCIVGDAFDYVILDRPGAGDSLSAGLIGGYLGICRDGTLDESAPLAHRVKTGLDLGNRMAIVAQKTVGDLGPVWSAKMYFSRVSKSKEIAR